MLSFVKEGNQQRSVCFDRAVPDPFINARYGAGWRRLSAADLGDGGPAGYRCTAGLAAEGIKLSWFTVSIANVSVVNGPIGLPYSSSPNIGVNRPAHENIEVSTLSIDITTHRRITVRLFHCFLFVRFFITYKQLA